MQFIYWIDSVLESYLMLGCKFKLFYVFFLAIFFFISSVNFNDVILLKKIMKRSFKKIITILIKRLWIKEKKLVQKNQLTWTDKNLIPLFNKSFQTSKLI